MSTQRALATIPPAPPLSRYGLPVLLLATTMVLGITPLTDGDVWWHLKFGEVFLQHRGFPAHDPFVFTAGNDPWIVRSWLAEIFFALVYRLAGPAGLILLKAALFALAMGLLWYLGVTLRCPAPLAALCLLLAVLAARPRLVERPEIFSFLLLAAALAVLFRRAVGRIVYLLVPLEVLWSNLHTSFYLGLLLPWPFVADELARRRWPGQGDRRAAPPATSLRNLVLAALLLVPASALSPQGSGVFLYPFQQAAMPTLREVKEVQGMVANLRGGTAGPQEVMALILLALGAAMICARRRAAGEWVGPGTWSLVVASAFAPFAVYRFLPYSGLILAAVMMEGLGFLVAEDPDGVRFRLGPAYRLTSAAAALLLVLATAHAFRAKPVAFGLGVAPDIFPDGAARFIRTAEARGPLFNGPDFGGYLLWSLYPRHRVFIHSDFWNSATTDRLMARVFQSEQDPATFNALVREYGIELMVLPSPGTAWRFVAADPRWALLFWDQAASVYARRGGANAALIAARELRWTHYAPDLSYLLPLAQDSARFPAAAAELRRFVAEDPANWAARLSLAFLLKAAGQELPEALAQVEAVQRQGLQDPTILTWRAELLARLGRPAEAEGAARAALRRNPTARAARLILADVRAQAGDRAEAIRLLQALLALPDLAPDQRREAEGRLRALASGR